MRESNIILFPKDRRTAEFYNFILHWSDGVKFYGETVEECFRRQKDYFEPEITMLEYLERFRYRLKVVTGCEYEFETIDQLCEILKTLGYIKVEQIYD